MQKSDTLECEVPVLNDSCTVDYPVPQTIVPLWNAGYVSRFYQAIVRKDTVRVKSIIESDPSMAIVQHHLGWKPIHAAVLSGDIETIRLILSMPGSLVDATDDSTFSWNSRPENISSRRQELSPVLDKGVNTNGATALHYACLLGDWEVIHLLLRFQASTSTKDSCGRIPIHYFDTEIKPQSVEAFSRFQTYLTKLPMKELSTDDKLKFLESIVAKRHDQCKKVLELCPAMACIITSGYGTPLLTAVCANNLPAVKMILSTSHGVDYINQPDEWQLSRHNTREIETRTIFYPKDIAEAPGFNATPLHRACLTGEWEIIEVLLNKGADWELKDDNGKIPRDFLHPELDSDVIKKYDVLCDSIENLEKQRLEAERKAQEEAKKLEREKLEREKLEREQKKKREQTRIQAEDSTSDDQSDNDKSDEKKDKNDQSNKNRVEPDLLTERNKFRQENPLEDFISATVVGQRGPIQSISSAVRLRENGWASTTSPLVFLFLGSSGVGKTEIAKQLAMYLNKKPWLNKSKNKRDDKEQDLSLNQLEDGGGFIRLDMSEYQESHTVTNLFGAPKSYVGYGEGGTLSAKLHKNPEAIVLLDEIEKAHPDVLTVFLQLFDDGRITDSSIIHCPNAIFIMTSNVASDEIKAHSSLLRLDEKDPNSNCMQTYRAATKKFLKMIYPTLKRSFERDEFLGRINQTLVMLPLSENEVGIIIENQLQKWRKRARDGHSMQLSWSPQVIKHLSKAYDQNFGARSLAYEVEHVVLRVVAEAQMSGEISYGWLVHLIMEAKASSVGILRLDPTKQVPEKRGCRYYSPW